MMFLTLPVLDGRYRALYAFAAQIESVRGQCGLPVSRVVSFFPPSIAAFPVLVRAAVMGRKHHGLQALPRGEMVG